jgi:hypothetical protein
MFAYAAVYGRCTYAARAEILLAYQHDDQLSDLEIAVAQREARDWMTSH